MDCLEVCFVTRLFTGYVRNMASWILAADESLREKSKAPLVSGQAFFVGDGVKTLREMSEVSKPFKMSCAAIVSTVVLVRLLGEGLLEEKARMKTRPSLQQSLT